MSQWCKDRIETDHVVKINCNCGRDILQRVKEEIEELRKSYESKINDKMGDYESLIMRINKLQKDVHELQYNSPLVIPLYEWMEKNGLIKDPTKEE